MDLIYQDETYSLRGAIFDVYREMGCGFLESVYQECLEKEFTQRGISFSPQQELKLYYKNQILKQNYKPDFICFGKIIVEIKSVSDLTQQHKAQLMNYLHGTKLRLGLLVNFGSYPKAEIIRIAL